MAISWLSWGEQVHSILSQYQAEYPAILDIATSLSLNKLFGFFLQTEGNLSRVNDILYDAHERLWDEVARYSECMRSHRVSHVPDPFGDRPSGMLTLLHAPWKPASSSRRPLHVETRMHARGHYM